jgi:hypothetical protein
VFSRWMDVALYQPNRAVTKDRRQVARVDSGLREARCESVAEVVKDERKYNPRSRRFCADSVMGPVYSCDVLARKSRRRETPL